MLLKIHQIDAFAERPFEGNPAAVVPLDAWIPDPLMQAVAMENQLSETAFLVADGGGGGGDYRIRWFTPVSEIDLCGHATLAAAWVVFNELRPGLESVCFRSQSGPLRVTRDAAEGGGWLELDFPARPPAPAPGLAATLAAALGAEPREALSSRDLVAVFEAEEQVRALRPDFARMAALPGSGVLATAECSTGAADFVSRCFFPKEGIPEDPVTGSAHCTLVPYWAARLNKARLQALQLSRRGGRLRCEDRGGRVGIAGQAVRVMEGTMDVPFAPPPDGPPARA
jgi:PhzF family phenazine biosynthesis protein